MDVKFVKKDFWLTIFAGEIITWLSLPTLKNLKLLEFLSERGIELPLFIVFWMFFIPISALLGIYSFYLMAKYKNRIGFLQMGKYGVIGVLNTFLNAGVYNALIFLTDITRGFSVDLFFAIAFIITVTNSFIWNKYWSFEDSKTETLKEEAMAFFGVSAVVAMINIAVLHVIINVIGAPANIDPKIWANIALASTIIIAFFGNFFGYKFIVFKK